MDAHERKTERSTRQALEQVGIHSRIKIMKKLIKEYEQYLPQTQKPTMFSPKIFKSKL
jgi:hypothetical protein